MFADHPEFPPPPLPDTLFTIPMIANFGLQEKGKAPYAGSIDTFTTYRAHHTPIALAPDPRTGHWCGDSRYLAIPFFDACLTMRLPDPGSADQTLKPVDSSHAWLAEPLSNVAVPAADFKGDRAKAVWLPNAAVAKAWMDYVHYGMVEDLTPPPAPTNVQVHSTDAGNDITWNADVDFESGIAGFIIVRDGKALARLPQNPPTKVFGRPLFQGISHGDTPDSLNTPMRYLDTTAKPTEKHIYTLITLNGMNTPSDPSAPYIDHTVAPMDR
jgi:hypothetical protein